MEQLEEFSLYVPQLPQPFLGDPQRSQMNHVLEKGLICIRIASAFELRQLKARLQAGQVNYWSVQGFGEIGEGVHGVDEQSHY